MPPSCRLRSLAGHVVAPAAAAKGATEMPLEAAPDAAAARLSSPLAPSASDVDDFHDTGILILRGCLSPTELDQLAGPQRLAYQNLDYDGRDQLASKDTVYPAPGIYSMGPKILESVPETGAVSCGHPKIVATIEALFGEPAVLAQYWSIMRPPGAGVPNNAEWVPGRAAHYDYKPWRCVGSFTKWMFAVIPFVDYTPEAGPLAIVPGSKHTTTVLPSDGRVHMVDAGQVPTFDEVGPKLVDPQLRRGDVVLMHGFTWHEAWPNQTDTTDRCGLYMKFHAKSAPPACGPTIYPTAAMQNLPASSQHVIPYHRSDGKFARSDGISNDHGVDEARLLIEDPRGELLLVPRGNPRQWSYPCYKAADDPAASILDVCNVVGDATAAAKQHLGLQLPWLSWLKDIPASSAGVFAHRLTALDAAKAAESEDLVFAGARWVSPTELEGMAAAGELECGAQEVSWLGMWVNEQDEEGGAVVRERTHKQSVSGTRAYGFPSTDVSKYVYNQAGNDGSFPESPSSYRVGQLDEDGEPLPKGFERVGR